MDNLDFLISSPPYGYAGATIMLIRATWVVRHVRRRLRGTNSVETRRKLPARFDIRSNISQLPVALLLVADTIYMTTWSSLFFPIKGFADQHGIVNIGSFFSVQIGVMIAIRLFAGKLFDAFDKAWMVVATFAVVILGYLALDNPPGTWAISLAAGSLSVILTGKC